MLIIIIYQSIFYDINKFIENEDEEIKNLNCKIDNLEKIIIKIL